MDSSYVFNIQNYSLHDGPGIRTLIFLKGCPLRCKWCSNPESQLFTPELACNSKRCIGKGQCGRCEEKCHKGAISFHSEDKIIIDRMKCDNCLQCIDGCPSQSLSAYGEEYNYKEIVDKVEKESSFHSRSGGGLTLSGGEPLAQGEYTVKILKEAKRRRINTAMETCGYAPWETLKEVAQYLDTILFDIKTMNPVKHEEYTGVSNKLILDNFSKLSQEYPNLKKIVRTPVIPGFNDSDGDKHAILEFVKQYSNTTHEFLSYHRLGQPKYEYLGRENPMESM